jgi:hypothetical protein
MQLWKVVEQVPGRNRESVGGSEMLCEWRVFVGGGALPSLLIIFSVSGTVNVMCLFISAAACLLILYSLETIIIAQWAQ